LFLQAQKAMSSAAAGADGTTKIDEKIEEEKETTEEKTDANELTLDIPGARADPTADELR
jgi:hypothetical protein